MSLSAEVQQIGVEKGFPVFVAKLKVVVRHQLPDIP
jgi:hypothetical protein